MDILDMDKRGPAIWRYLTFFAENRLMSILLPPTILVLTMFNACVVAALLAITWLIPPIDGMPVLLPASVALSLAITEFAALAHVLESYYTPAYVRHLGFRRIGTAGIISLVLFQAMPSCLLTGIGGALVMSVSETPELSIFIGISTSLLLAGSVVGWMALSLAINSTPSSLSPSRATGIPFSNDKVT